MIVRYRPARPDRDRPAPAPVIVRYRPARPDRDRPTSRPAPDPATARWPSALPGVRPGDRSTPRGDRPASDPVSVRRPAR
ncbi:hypothetical protein A6A29_10465 [Streptomyces sp. TSRI0281]|nr:hypothetical protein A6A29_10465 [Streptomyces sp. TSRI0281]